jgi:signal transduction histidine kinase/ActR/RegA family two-component response regulator
MDQENDFPRLPAATSGKHPAAEPSVAYDTGAGTDLDAITRLYEVGNRCASPGSDIQQCLEDILDAAIGLSGADKGHFRVFDPCSRTLKVQAQRGFEAHFLAAIETAAPADANDSADLRVLIEDVTQNPIAGVPTLLDAGVRALQSTPLISSSGDLLGVIATHFHQPYHPRERDLRFMDLLARQAADYLERKRYEAAMHESEARYRTLFDSMDEGYCIVRMVFDEADKPVDYVFEVLNRAFEQHTGLHDAVGRSVREFVPAHEKYWFEIYGRVARTGQSERFISPANALGRWYDAYAFRIGKPGEDLVAVLFRDISEQKLSEEKVRQSEQRLRSIIEQLPAGVGVMDAGGQWTLSNSVMDRYVPNGIPSSRPERIRQWRGWDENGALIPPENWPSRRALRGETVMPGMEMLHTADDGKETWVRTTAAPLRYENGKVVEACAVVVDITQLKSDEQALREIDRRKDQFLATLSHELRNPLAPIRNGIEILRLAGLDTPAAGRVLDMVNRQVDVMVRLVDDLMDVSRISGGKVQLRKEQVDLAGMVRNAIEISRPLIEASHHQLTVDLAEETLVMEGDPVRLAQAITNLLNNAAKYTDTGGEIRLGLRREGSEAIISVRDNGIGIPADMLSKVFDLFAQVEQAYNRTQGGLGVGLTLARSLVDMHGGRLEAKSAGVAGQGSEFIVHLPLPAGAASPAALSDPENRVDMIAPLRILIVDDNEDSADSLAMLLEVFGSQVQAVHDGHAALTALAGFAADVVILDIGMPDMDGYEMARCVRTQFADREISLIAVTGWGQDEDRRRSREAGINHHFVKPIDLDALERLLAKLADAKQKAFTR